jgi:hypothetical protein
VTDTNVFQLCQLEIFGDSLTEALRNSARALLVHVILQPLPALLNGKYHINCLIGSTWTSPTSFATQAIGPPSFVERGQFTHRVWRVLLFPRRFIAGIDMASTALFTAPTTATATQPRER